MAQFASDAFGGTENAELAAYNAAWTRHTSYSVNSEIASGRVRTSASGNSAYYHSGTPASADYSVNCDLYFHETDGGDSNASVMGRVSTSANTFYMARYVGSTSDRWELYKCVSGTFTLLGSSPQSISAVTSNNIKLEMIGSAIKLYKQGSATALISVTDTSITAAGKSGIRMVSSNGDTTGIHVDNYSADDVGGGGASLFVRAAGEGGLAGIGGLAGRGGLAG